MYLLGVQQASKGACLMISGDLIIYTENIFGMHKTKINQLFISVNLTDYTGAAVIRSINCDIFYTKA